ncbi:hemerythrin domain-containing protein [Falsiroseomonas ponticola]|jgi:regulator of cell morphogenesis and NO signaling|uniref:hemerythrin domain-containing protein n=1 Tax=Falsiroseomonas ponticola TaxID=2786951 RepID=UPI001933917C|nr:hemerythrin domain-containing protein [Roseomonas ponticola]
MLADAAEADDAALIAHILDRYHAEHRRQLPELLRLARGATPALAEALSRIAYEMEGHMRKEEDGLFPMILGGHDNLGMAVEIMRDDHEAHLERLDALLALPVAPGGEALRDALGRFAADLREHIRLEDEVLFPRCGA